MATVGNYSMPNTVECLIMLHKEIESTVLHKSSIRITSGVAKEVDEAVPDDFQGDPRNSRNL